MDHYGSLRGHYSLQIASEVKSDLRFEISDLSYIYVPNIKITSIVQRWLNWQAKEENYDPLACVALPQVKMALEEIVL